MRQPLRAFFWMAAGACCFSVMNVLAKVASESVHFTVVASLRAAVGALVAFVAARLTDASLRVHDRRTMWLRSAFGTLAMLATFAALSERALPVGDAATLFNLAPVGIAVLSPWVLGERSGRRIGVSVLFCLLGAVCILRPTFLFPSGREYPRGPAAVAMLAALSTSCAMMMLRRVRHESSAGVAFHFSCFACVSTSLLALPHLWNEALPGATTLAVMIGAGLAAGCGQLCMTRAYALDHAARVAAYGYLSVAGSALMAYLVRGERLDRVSVAGMLMVTLGGLVVSLTAKRENAPLSGVVSTRG